jgi:Ca2+-binding RTX toxin-like protein
MALIKARDKVTTETAFVLKAGQDLLIGQGVDVFAVGGNYGIVDIGQSNTITVNGTLSAALAIYLTDQVAGPERATAGITKIQIGAQGKVIAEGDAIRMTKSAEIVNKGMIAGADGIVAPEIEGGPTLRLINHGEMKVQYYAVESAKARCVIFNDGVIVSENQTAFILAATDDVLVNRGTIRGAVWLDEGADRFDGRGGRVLGPDSYVSGGGGNDRFILDGLQDRVSGGTGDDTLDFRHTTKGVDIALLDLADLAPASPQRAYSDFEILLGGSGRDRFVGDRYENRLVGHAGVDTLDGRDGNDTLIGGAGRDVLIGGAGDDVFRFDSRADAGDRIRDFSNGGQDDSFAFRKAAFGKGMDRGMIEEEAFLASTTNRAGDISDRFIFRTTDSTLWYDADGTGRQPAILIADLKDGVAMSSSDIFIV